MTKFVLDGRTATEHFPGIGRYVINLARAMAPLMKEGDRLLLLRDPTASSWWSLAEAVPRHVEVVNVAISPFSLQQQWAVPRLLHLLQADMYHSPYYLMPYRTGVPTVLTVYDLIPLLFPQHVSVRARWLFRWATALAMRTSRHVLTISEATRQDLLSTFRLPAARVTAIPLAVDPCIFLPPQAEVHGMRRKYALPKDYVLYVGINKPHKNLTGLIDAWAQLLHQLHRRGSMQLVIAGAWDPRYPEPRDQAKSLGLSKAVRFLGPVPEDDLRALYGGATLFVFPSLYEGFGLPALEAMACGAPVVCSAIPSLQEIVGEGALLTDPRDTQTLAETMQLALDSVKLREQLREKGLAQARKFSWIRTAQQTLAVYEKLAN